MNKHSTKRICIIQPVMKQYRKPFFIELQKVLEMSDISLQVVYGEPWPEEAMRGDNTDLPPSLGLSVPTYRFFRKLFIQPSLMPWLKADLVILEPANKHALNYLLILLYGLKIKRIAYWGHGYDRQTPAHTLGNKFKRKSLHWVEWWFAYTAETAEYLRGQDYDSKRITVVENAIDTRYLRSLLLNVTQIDIDKVRVSLDWDAKSRICVFCGSLYPNKKLDLLFESALLIHDRVPGFRLLIMGGGPLESMVDEFVSTRDWVSYLGPVFNRDKAVILKMAELWLNPGLVGLGILDGFSAGLPVITTNVDFHSPEIEYLEDNVNGLMVSPDAESYAEAVLSLLTDVNLLKKLTRGALNSADRYSIETMVANFANGIKKCLNLS